MRHTARPIVGRVGELLQDFSSDIVDCNRVIGMMGEMPKFWTCFEGRGFANGFYMGYKRENKLITRLWPYYQEKKMELLPTGKRKKWKLRYRFGRDKSGNGVAQMPS